MNKQISSIASRRDFLHWTAGAALAASTGSLFAQSAFATKESPRKVVVGAHPWVYAATLPEYDITPILGSIARLLRGMMRAATIS